MYLHLSSTAPGSDIPLAYLKIWNDTRYQQRSRNILLSLTLTVSLSAARQAQEELEAGSCEKIKFLLGVRFVEKISRKAKENYKINPFKKVLEEEWLQIKILISVCEKCSAHSCVHNKRGWFVGTFIGVLCFDQLYV